MGATYTHPDVLTRGIEEGWAEAETDPTRIDWAERQANAAIWFDVIDGRPVKPGDSTGIEHGRGELGHWGEKQAADAIVFAHTGGARWVLLVERDDDYGWAIPGGCLDPDEKPLAAAIRELEEETGLLLPGAYWQVHPARVVPDPRATDEAWMVTTPAVTDLGDIAHLPAVAGADDARRAEWVQADTYTVLTSYLEATYGGHVFAAHQALLVELFDIDQVADAIANALHDRDLEKARDHFDHAVVGSQAALDALAKQLAADVEIPRGTVVVGFSIDVWGNPHRDGYAWRCGDCPWTGSNYTTAPAAQHAAETHAADHKEPKPKVQDYAVMTTTGHQPRALPVPVQDAIDYGRSVGARVPCTDLRGVPGGDTIDVEILIADPNDPTESWEVGTTWAPDDDGHWTLAHAGARSFKRRHAPRIELTTWGEVQKFLAAPAHPTLDPDPEQLIVRLVAHIRRLQQEHDQARDRGYRHGMELTGKEIQGVQTALGLTLAWRDGLPEERPASASGRGRDYVYITA